MQIGHAKQLEKGDKAGAVEGLEEARSLLKSQEGWSYSLDLLSFLSHKFYSYQGAPPDRRLLWLTL